MTAKPEIQGSRRAVDMRPTVDDEANAAWAEVNRVRAANEELRTKLADVGLHLGYALDALEGKPWTGWTTDDARQKLEGIEKAANAR